MATLDELYQKSLRPVTMQVLEGNPCPECGFDHGESDERKEQQPMPDMQGAGAATIGRLRVLPEES